MKLPITSPYTAKDQRKADNATCFIGRGSPKSSTNAYMLAYGELANKGTYSPSDVVFVSVEGARSGRVPLPMNEVQSAITAGASFITDDSYNRNRPYNVGERELERVLRDMGYKPTEKQGYALWTKNT